MTDSFLNKTKEIAIGDNQTLKTSYYELKQRYNSLPTYGKGGVDRLYLLKVIEREFPEAYAEDNRIVLEKRNRFRWSRFLNTPSQLACAHEWIDPNILLIRARNYVAHESLKGELKYHHQVSDFTKWIYEISGVKTTTDVLLEGKYAERRIWIKKKKNITTLNPINEWSLIYRDPLDDIPAKGLKISSLEINGKPMYGTPDYVFRNNLTGEIVIVEVKVSKRNLHPNGWPNLRAQLWAYSHIDEFLNKTKDITLIGEVWDKNDLSQPRYTYKWHTSDNEFNKNNEKLFLEYKRVVEESNSN